MHSPALNLCTDDTFQLGQRSVYLSSTISGCIFNNQCLLIGCKVRLNIGHALFTQNANTSMTGHLKLLQIDIFLAERTPPYGCIADVSTCMDTSIWVHSTRQHMYGHLHMGAQHTSAHVWTPPYGCTAHVSTCMDTSIWVHSTRQHMYGHLHMGA